MQAVKRETSGLMVCRLCDDAAGIRMEKVCVHLTALHPGGILRVQKERKKVGRVSGMLVRLKMR